MANIEITHCDPCICLEMYYQNEEAWRKAVLKILCEIIVALEGDEGNV